MSELPQLDPNWTRRRQHSQDRVPVVAGLVVTAIVLGGRWLARSQLEMQETLQQANSNSQILGAMTESITRAKQLITTTVDWLTAKHQELLES
jgi:hypothetical protein